MNADAAAPGLMRTLPPQQPTPPPGVSRRTFLQRAASTAALVTLPSFLPPRILGQAGQPSPANRIRVALFGRGAMGAGHLRRLLGDPAFQVVAVCDPDRIRRDEGLQIVEAHYAEDRATGRYRGCLASHDHREALALDDLDAVVIASPDHWHAQQSIDAARAGKDVYCEKPVSMTIQEGRRIAEAVHRYGRIFQTGTQYRSMSTIRRVVQFIREGGLGRVHTVFTQLHSLGGWLHSARFQPYAHVVSPGQCGGSYPPLDFALPPEPVPDGLDWDMWVGPAPWRPYNRLYHINPSPGVVPWSFCEAFGVTSSTWFLSHAADVIQYALGLEESGPVELHHPADGNYPTLTFRYANGTLLHFIHDWPQVKSLYRALPDDARVAGMFGGLFLGERGWLTALYGGGPIQGAPDSLFADLDLRTREVSGTNDHHANWRDCIRTRTRPYCDAELGHRTATLGHLTNIPFQIGRSLKWDPVRELFPDEPAANRLLARPNRPPYYL